jgi:hypothetical protein
MQVSTSQLDTPPRLDIVDHPVLIEARSLIFTLRPSIAWRLGLASAPMDLLDDNGILGWRLGTTELRRNLNDLNGSRAVDGLRTWLANDALVEPFRWRSLHTVLMTACLALGHAGQARTATDADLVAGVWMRNVNAAFTRVGPTYTPSRAELRLAARLGRLLPAGPGTELIRQNLDQLVLAEDTPKQGRGHVGPVWDAIHRVDEHALREVLVPRVN